MLEPSYASDFLIPGKLYRLRNAVFINEILWSTKPRIMSHAGDILLFVGSNSCQGSFLLKDNKKGFFDLGSPMSLHPENYFERIYE